MPDFAWTDRNRTVYRAHLTLRIRAGEEVLERIDRLTGDRILPDTERLKRSELQKVIDGYKVLRADTERLSDDDFDRLTANRFKDLLR